ncbi:growth/differentiation factor 8-like [Schistocerca gregaria]|uniref:growth/differentiation factor 8-like n=1 Tax=Schistocerca gregaria TaxID=7010 RepID=UPI00211E6714|nr:growth/differentiation factor 8-like [Schistocerca gregaria]
MAVVVALMLLFGSSLAQEGGAAEATTPASGEPHCASCLLREELRNMSLNNIKMQILSKLGMKHPPNMTGRQRPPIPTKVHTWLDLYQSGGGGAPAAWADMQGDEPAGATGRLPRPGPLPSDPDDDDFHARTEQVLAFARPHTKLPYGRRSHDVQMFRFSEKVMRNVVTNATLYLYLRDAGGGRSSSSVNVTVMRVLSNPQQQESPMLEVVYVKNHVSLQLPHWYAIEMQKVVAHWFRFPRENHGIVVQAVDSSGRQLVVTTADQDEGSRVPFIEVLTADGRKHRSKRTVGLNCDERSEETRCCRYPLTVDFEEFGWDWIIAPKKYEANYCAGECPYVFLQKFPHTHIVHLANPAGSIGPCCAPRKLSAISMLYFDNEYNIIYGLLPGMVVDRCGCS